jgi:hypothetical protein
MGEGERACGGGRGGGYKASPRPVRTLSQTGLRQSGGMARGIESREGVEQFPAERGYAGAIDLAEHGKARTEAV